MTSSQPAAPATLVAPAAEIPSDRRSATSRPLRWWIALAVAAAWILSLAALAWLTANPVTLNRDQILRSTRVVTARVIDAAGTCEVERQWTSGPKLSSLSVGNLEQTGAEVGARYILPLIPSARNQFQVTPLRHEGPLLIYPATAEAERQLQEILAEK